MVVWLSQLSGSGYTSQVSWVQFLVTDSLFIFLYFCHKTFIKNYFIVLHKINTIKGNMLFLLTTCMLNSTSPSSVVSWLLWQHMLCPSCRWLPLMHHPSLTPTPTTSLWWFLESDHADNNLLIVRNKGPGRRRRKQRACGLYCGWGLHYQFTRSSLTGSLTGLIKFSFFWLQFLIACNMQEQRGKGGGSERDIELYIEQDIIPFPMMS